MLLGEGVLIDGDKSTPVTLQFKEGKYVKKDDDHKTFTRAQLVLFASEGKFVGTFTARHGAKVGIDNPQPGIWTLGPIEAQRGHQDFPVLSPDNTTMTVSGRHLSLIHISEPTRPY